MGNNRISPPQYAQGWRTRAYLTWTAVGAAFGLVSGVMYTRAAREHSERFGGQPPRAATGELLVLALAALGVLRQIAELGKPNKKS